MHRPGLLLLPFLGLGLKSGLGRTDLRDVDVGFGGRRLGPLGFGRIR
ncbi:hypothetical protein [Planotetraspora mira]|nr:hypothetical protein [Planotetraspora mira]